MGESWSVLTASSWVIAMKILSGDTHVTALATDMAASEQVSPTDILQCKTQYYDWAGFWSSSWYPWKLYDFVKKWYQAGVGPLLGYRDSCSDFPHAFDEKCVKLFSDILIVIFVDFH